MEVRKTFTKEQILNSDPEEIGAEGWRHGRRATMVFREEEESGPYWRFTVDIHPEEGLQFYGPTVECVQVRQEERIVKVWVPVVAEGSE